MARSTGTTIRCHPEIDSGVNEELEQAAHDLKCQRNRNEIIGALLAICSTKAAKSGLSLTGWVMREIEKLLESYDLGDMREQLIKSVEGSFTTSIFDRTRTLGRLRTLYNSPGALEYRVRRKLARKA